MNSDRLRKFFMFDGLTLIILLVVGGLATLDGFWLFITWAPGLGAASGYWSPPKFIDIPLRIIAALNISFLGAYITRLRQGFERVRLSITVAALGAGAFIIFLLHILGVINVIPG